MSLRKYYKYEQRHRVVAGVKEKLCHGCGKWKREREFYKHHGKRDGLSEWCKECSDIATNKCRKRRWSPPKKIIRIPGTKRCVKCRIWKKESEFYENIFRKDGLEFWCKKCVRGDRGKYYMRGGKTKVRKSRRYAVYHRIVKGVKQKQCIECKKWKPEDGFYKQKKAADGLGSWCKMCLYKHTRKKKK